jgi:hypothetical protein
MKLLKTKLNPKHSVKELLLDRVGGNEPARSIHQLHASDLTKQEPDFCPRQFWLHRHLDIKRPDQYVQHAMRVTWDEGRDKQWRLNNEYLRDVMWGHWKCMKCGDMEKWQSYPPETPNACVKGHHLWEYEEPVFEHPSGFTGSLDGVIQFTPAKRRMLEVKIMKGDDFKDLKAPLAEHRVRTQLYLRLLAEANTKPAASIDTSVAHILYWMRGHGVKADGGISPFREFLIERNDEAVDKYIRMAQALRDGVPEGVCADSLCSRANSCTVAKQCFSGKYPADQRWRKA